MIADVPAKGIMGVVDEGRAAAAADAIEALRFVRAHAAEYDLDPGKVGMIGFSAGGATTLRVLQDAPDDVRPDLAASIYGLLLDEDVRPRSTPLFIAVAADDLVEDAQKMQELWQSENAPAEVHIFEDGGHGFGLGRPETDSMRFPDRLETWREKHEFIKTIAEQ